MKKWGYAVLVVTGLLALAAFGLVRLWQDPPLGFYLHWSMSPHVLPVHYIRPAFRYATGRDLPAVVQDAQAIWSGDREPSTFVRFRTDPNGLAYIEETFGGPRAESETFSAEDMRILTGSGANFYPNPVLWQERLGISIFDPKTLGAGRRISYGKQHGGGWRIFIDEEHGVVYILAWPYT
jgi:hypothetical protein